MLIVDGESEFNQDVITFCNNFKTKYDQLLEAYNGDQCVMLLIENVTTTSKRDQYLKEQHYTILTKVVDETTQICFFQLRNKLSNAQPALKEISLFPIVCIIQCFFQFYTKISNKTKCSSHG